MAYRALYGSFALSDYAAWKAAVSTFTTVYGAPLFIFYGGNSTSGNIENCAAVFVGDIIVELDLPPPPPSTPPTITQFITDFPNAVASYFNIFNAG